MNLLLKAFLGAIVCEGVSFFIWSIGIRIIAAEPQMTIFGYIGGYLHYPGIRVEAWAHSKGYGDTMIPIISIPFLCWFILWLIILKALKMREESEHAPPEGRGEAPRP